MPIAPGDEGHWVHHIDPFVFVLGHWHGNPIGVRWYGLAYLAGLVCGYFIVRRWVRLGRCPLRPEQIQDFVLWPGLGMIIGGRVYYCLFYAWDQLLANPFGHYSHGFEAPFLLQVWNGGMASHGGIIGLAVGCWLFARRNGLSFTVLADVISATGPLGVAFGRLANFINGELWGRPSHEPWAVIFPDAPLVDGYAVARHPSQLYAMVLEGILPFLLVLPLHARHRRPGLTSAVLLCCYAVGRFTDEFFREPDMGQPGGAPLPGQDPVPPILGFMSKGQLFTLPVLLIGIVWMIWALRRPPRPELYVPPSQPAPKPG